MIFHSGEVKYHNIKLFLDLHVTVIHDKLIIGAYTEIFAVYAPFFTCLRGIFQKMSHICPKMTLYVTQCKHMEQKWDIFLKFFPICPAPPHVGHHEYQMIPYFVANARLIRPLLADFFHKSYYI